MYEVYILCSFFLKGKEPVSGNQGRSEPLQPGVGLTSIDSQISLLKERPVGSRRCLFLKTIFLTL